MVKFSIADFLEKRLHVPTRDRGLGGAVRRLERWAVTNYPRIRIVNSLEVLECQLENWSRLNPSKIDMPLLLVSQMQRSGGSLMMQLFDGHPSLRCYPNELDRLKGLGPQGWHKMLGSKPSAKEILDPWVFKTRFGYTKMSGNMSHLQNSEVHLEQFFFSYRVFKHVYAKLLIQSESSKEVLNAYFTAFFHAWLNDVNRIGDKQYLVGFAPGAMKGGLEDILFFLNADERCKIVSVIRDPYSWYASARRHSGRYGTIEAATELWFSQVSVHVDAWRKHPDRVLPILFSDLVSQTDLVMQRVSKFLHIPDDPVTRVPTFNRVPFWSNSSFEVKRGELDQSVLERGAKELSNQERKFIEGKFGAYYLDLVSKLSGYLN